MRSPAGRPPPFPAQRCEDVSFYSRRRASPLPCEPAHPAGPPVVGITGRSGSGKSTLLRLLMRFWDADGGAVRVSPAGTFGR